MKKVVLLLTVLCVLLNFSACTQKNGLTYIDYSSLESEATVDDEYYSDTETNPDEIENDTNNVDNITQSESSDGKSDTTSTSTAGNKTNTATTSANSTHTHSFSSATCTEPKKCSCGATQGAPLGHTFENGVCKRCNAKDTSQSQYTVIYDSNGGWGTTDSSTHICNEKRALSRNGFKRAGYTFLGWNTDSNATTAQYSDTQSVENLAQNNQTVTLYAIWQESQTSSFDDCVMTASSNGSAQYHQTATDNLGQTHSDVAIFASEVGDNWLSEYKTDERFVNGLFSKIKGVAYLKDSEKNDSFTEVKLVIYGDGNIIYTSDSLTQYSGAISFDVDISGINVIRIEVKRPSKYIYNLGGQILVENLILSR